MARNRLAYFWPHVHQIPLSLDYLRMYAQPVAMPTQLSEQIEAADADNPDSAVATLRREMLFYRDQATTLCEKIMELLKDQNARGDLIAMMYKYANEAKKMTIDCANKLAPYESPKLQAIEVKETRVTKFVIEAPTLATDPNSWLSNVKSERKLLNDMRNNADEVEIIEDHARLGISPESVN